MDSRTFAFFWIFSSAHCAVNNAYDDLCKAPCDKLGVNSAGWPTPNPPSYSLDAPCIKHDDMTNVFEDIISLLATLGNGGMHIFTGVCSSGQILMDEFFSQKIVNGEILDYQSTDDPENEPDKTKTHVSLFFFLDDSAFEKVKNPQIEKGKPFPLEKFMSEYNLKPYITLRLKTNNKSKPIANSSVYLRSALFESRTLIWGDIKFF